MCRHVQRGTYGHTRAAQWELPRNPTASETTKIPINKRMAKTTVYNKRILLHSKKEDKGELPGSYIKYSPHTQTCTHMHMYTHTCTSCIPGRALPGPDTSQVYSKYELSWFKQSIVERGQESMSQEEPLAERECNKEKIPGLHSVDVPSTREGAEAKRKPRDTAHLVSGCLHSSQAHTWGNLGIGDQTQAGVRMGKEGCKRPRQQAHTLASLPHYQLLTSCLTKLVKCVFESPYLWEELWGMERARPLRGPQWPPSP